MSLDKTILCIETATKNCSVAIFRNENLISIREEESDEYIHSEKLATFIEEVFQESKINPTELSAIAVSAGPGSYTGLRIGVSTAKGICLAANNVPLISVPNLLQMAHKARMMDTSFDYYIPMLDARRMEVYTIVFNGELTEIKETHAKIIDDSSYVDLKGRVAIFGDGAEKCLTTLGHLSVELLEVKCSARNMATIAFNKLSKGEFENLAYYEPFYLKDFIAGAPKKVF